MNIIRYLRRKTEFTFVYDYKTVQHTLRLMRSHGYTSVPVVNQDGMYMGALEEGDFLWAIVDYGYEKIKDDRIGTLVHKGSVPALKITAADEELKNAAARCIFTPIVDDRGVFIGVVTRNDILQYFAGKMRDETMNGIA